MSEELFSYRLRKYREQHDLSQEGMGSILGVTARYIGQLERGDKEPDPSQALVKLFGLLEGNKVRVEQITSERKAPVSLREEPRSYNGTKPAPSAMDATHQRQSLMIERIREDSESMIGATPAQRRELATLTKIHIDHFIAWLNASGD